MIRDAARIDSIRQALREEGLDALVCSLPANVLLLTGYWPVVGTSLAIAAPGPRTILIVPEDEGDLAGAGWADEVRTYRPGSLEDLRTPEEAIRCPLGEASRSLGTCQRVGFESGGMFEPASYAALHLFGTNILSLLGEAFPSARLIPASEILLRLRSVKTSDEIDRIREACRIAETAFQKGASQLGVGLTEMQAAEHFRRGLGDGGSLPVPGRAGGFAWCMSGPNSAKACAAYARSGQRVLAQGDLVLVHCNSYTNGYWTDITRTYCLGSGDERIGRMVEAVFAARAAAMDAARPGAKAAAVDEAARRIFRDRGWGDAFKHSTGHGVGFGAISAEARPRLHPKADDILRPGMVFNIEPALYFEGYGGMRHCDMVALTSTGAELLTPFHASLKELLRTGLLALLWCCMLASTAIAQGPKAKGETPKQPSPRKDELSPAPAKVDVQPVARDEQIHKRLQSVLEATGWFNDPQVRVEEGVVFLNGRTETDELKKWASDLARNTQDVVAVANQIEVSQPSAWDYSGTWAGLLGLWRDFVRFLPFLMFGLFILILSAVAGWLATRVARAVLFRRVQAKLLRGVLAGAVGFFVFLAGTYVVLRVSGLTQLALTVVGGTGLIGLAVGIAFRDITENFLASIFLSMQRPFGTGDLIEVAGVTGYVQQLNIRTTIVMTLDGNLVQVPNALVYKSTLRNFTANPNRREDFVVGIGYDDHIDAAQEIARKVLADHPAVLNDPEPWVLADGLGHATVNLRIYFWLNGRDHSWLKVRSAVIRLVKRAFQQHGISMPDEAREVVFPRGVPVTLLDGRASQTQDIVSGSRPDPRPPSDDVDAVSTKAEAGLSSEAGALGEQARQAKPLDAGENLLREAPATSNR